MVWFFCNDSDWDPTTTDILARGIPEGTKSEEPETSN